MSYLLEHDTTPAYQITETENLSTRKAMNIGRDAWKLNPNQAWKDMRLKVATAIEMGRLPIDDFVRIQSAGTLAAQMVTPAPEQNSLNVEDIVTKVIAALDARDAAKQSSQEKPKED